MHLETVICEMNELAHLGQRVLIGASSEVAWFVKIEILVAVDEAQDADVKLAAIEKQWALNILLNDYFIATLHEHMAHQLLPTGHDLDASTSILILRLDYPDVLGQLAGG